MDKKTKTKYIIILTVAILGIITCIALITVKLTTNLFDKPSDSSGVQASSSQDENSTQEAPVLDAEGLMLTDFYAYAFTCDDKDYVYSGDLFYKTVTTELKPGKTVKLHYYDRNNAATFDGIPVLLEYNQSKNQKFGYTVPDEMKITFDEGSISTWENETAVYHESNSSFKPRTTIFWSCYDSPLDKEAAEKATVTATYYCDGAIIATQNIVFEQGKSTKGTNGDEIYSYSAECLK